MTEVFGIDLGTTYSAVARIDEFGMPVVIPNAEDEPTTPSVVYFESEDNVAVGKTAKNSALTDAANVVALIKRHMGEDFTQSYCGHEYTPETISALILKQLMQDAVAQTEIETNRVVITVPAYFGATEKDSTRKAGEIAGLDVVDIIAEPVAAALAYGVKQTDGEKTIFVYDLGGGTFDTTVLKISPEELEVWVIGGDRELGGADWDERLIAHLISEFRSATGISQDELEDENFQQDIAADAEGLKRNLSKLESKQVSIRLGSSSAKITVTREQFEQMTADLLNKSVDIVERTLKDSEEKAAKKGVPAPTIDEVLLVGGSSFMPAVARALKDRFGWEAKLSDPNQAVAKGAAIYGSSPVSIAADGEVDDDGKPIRALPGATASAIGGGRAIRTVIPKAIGVGVWCEHDDGVACEHSDANAEKTMVEFFIHKNESLPFVEKRQFATAYEGQTSVAIEVYEQAGDTESILVANNRLLSHEGGAVIEGLPALPKGSPIEIELDINKQGEAHLAAKDVTTGKELEFTINLGQMQEEAVKQAKARLRTISVGG
jgi:molecular chaperone DnaK (HSP70)